MITLALAIIVPVLVSAAQVTERSIALSNSSATATGVQYDVEFDAVGAAGAFVIDFCSNSPILGQECTPPAGFTAATATSSTSGFTDVNDIDANTITVTGVIDAGDTVGVSLAGITNPNTAGPLYARIVTYDNITSANAYTSENIGNEANVVDTGSVAVSITDTVGVSGAVMESMTFCASGAEITTENCATTTAPILQLGEPVNGTDLVALSTEAVSEGTIHTQITTNAVGGAIVSLKSNTTDCGGLKRAGAPTACDILPALATNILPGQAKFGVKIGAASDAGSEAAGTVRAYPTSGYNDTTYVLNYVTGNTSGVTSVYGDPILDTNSAPVNNKNMSLIFGAGVSNTTPAGLYSADISLIATGKF